MNKIKQHILTYTSTQVCLLVAIAVLLAIGCENQGKTPVVLHPKLYADSVRTVTVLPDSLNTLIIYRVGINRFWYDGSIQFTIKGHDSIGDYLIHMDKRKLQWLNDTTAVYSSLDLLEAHSEIGKDGER